MKKLLTVAFMAASVCALAASWDYHSQDEWEIVHGKHQSPINIESSEAINYDGRVWNNYEAGIVKEVVDNGHSIVARVEGAKSLIDGREFDLLQFHFHASSEHTLDGEYTPMEVHFVHQSKSGRYAVLGVFLVEGEENGAFDDIMGIVNEEKQEQVDLMQLLPNDKTFFHYLGSLTTPPLAENVEWYVYEKPVELSKGQIEEFMTYYSDNFRELQDIEGRSILKSH